MAPIGVRVGVIFAAVKFFSMNCCNLAANRYHTLQSKAGEALAQRAPVGVGKARLSLKKNRDAAKKSREDTHEARRPIDEA
jgi:hypothetical protein